MYVLLASYSSLITGKLNLSRLPNCTLPSVVWYCITWWHWDAVIRVLAHGCCM